MCMHILETRLTPHVLLYYFFAVEFPAVLLDIQTGKVVDEFQQYVLPRDNPKLSDFCKTLTGISQVNLLLYGCCQRFCR